MIQSGDVVNHIEGWDGDLPVVERVDSAPKDPVAFFVSGGFCRTSKLVKVEQSEVGE